MTLCFFCFPFFLLPCTSVSSPLDSSHNNSSLLESWLSIPASFSDATTILWISFLNPWSSLNFSNFLKTSAFYFTSVCCFIFLAFDLQTISALAFAHALSVSKGLQTALALVQGAHEVAWLYTQQMNKRKLNENSQQILRNVQDSEVCIPLTQTSFTNN